MNSDIIKFITTLSEIKDKTKNPNVSDPYRYEFRLAFKELYDYSLNDYHSYSIKLDEEDIKYFIRKYTRKIVPEINSEIDAIKNEFNIDFSLDDISNNE